MRIKTGLAFALVALFVLLFFPYGAFAIEYSGVGGKPANPDPQNPRTKSIFIFELNPGETDENQLLVINNSAETKTLLVYATDSQKSSDGSFACEQLSDTKDNVGLWINMNEEEVELPPTSNKIVDFSITVPESASVGEENGCVLIQEKKEDSQANSGIALSFRTGLRVVVTIPGEQVRSLDLTEFESRIYGENIIAKVGVTNSGNVSIDANVNVFFSGLFNTQLEQVSNTYPVLRGDTSIYNFEIPKPFWGGLVSVATQINYDNSQEASVGIDPEDSLNIYKASETITFFVAPSTPALFIELIIVVAIILAIVLLIKKQKKRKQEVELWSEEYFVRTGEDIQFIAAKFQVSWEDIAKHNKLPAPYLLQKGQRLLLPKKKD